MNEYSKDFLDMFNANRKNIITIGYIYERLKVSFIRANAFR